MSERIEEESSDNHFPDEELQFNHQLKQPSRKSLVVIVMAVLVVIVILGLLIKILLQLPSGSIQCTTTSTSPDQTQQQTISNIPIPKLDPIK